ncbi:alpha/beta fold hydrolase [Nocardia sp. ET3-3]|uniref:Alpha/beta fold hydrolase n=2 Tax=Nocardia terrae TaxID=2675851 RepID=A0A7K1V1D1_9NOCA|nr:alpha/beta fold hydrolase [Nocardia terrae]
MMNAQPTTAIRPFRIDVPQAQLDELSARLRNALYPNELPGVGDAYGVTADRVRGLADYWLNEFDWRALESELNAYPQFTTEIEGEDIHFLHVRSPREDAVPAVLIHGWPGSILEYLDVIEPLTNPADAASPAFHLVIPSLPGFGFSGPTRSTGWGTRRTARAFVELMVRLGYERFGAIGNDAGSMVAPEMARIAPDRLLGMHVTQLFSFPSGDPAEMADLPEEDLAALGHLQWFMDNKFSFNTLHSQQPQTLAFAISDSPIGLLGWNSQLMGESLDAEFIVGNTAIYWLTGTAASSIRFYWEDAHDTERTPGPTTVPTALCMFKGDFQSMRRFADRDHKNIVSWHAHDVRSMHSTSANDAAGHYAAHEAPEVLLADIRQFFARLA